MAGKKGQELAKGFSLPKAPVRSPVPEADARKFELARNATTAPTTTRITASSALRREERGERLTGYIPPELAEEFRVRCARERRSFSDALTEAIGTWLKIGASS